MSANLPPTAATIYALSSAPGRAGVAVIRVSGPAVPDVLARMAAPTLTDRQAAFRSIRHPLSGDVLDRAVVLYFAAPRSETGEHVAEFQVHGGRAVVAAVLAALSTLPDCRLAEPGEFARRAFENGKLDLAEVEGLADLVEAETEAQRRQALLQAGGAASRLYETWRTALIEIAALTEAAIDFSDEADVADASLAMARDRAGPLLSAIARHLDDGHRGEILRDGLRVALLGPPNAGKSSLLNALARREAAIVSAEAGTTRDVVEVRLDLRGLPVVLSDTAGLREAAGDVEREGMRRSLAAAEEANLVLWLSETGEAAPAGISRETVWPVRTKVDLVSDRSACPPRTVDGLDVSVRTGEGLEALVARVAGFAEARLGTTAGEAPIIAHVRHREALEQARGAVQAFLDGSTDAPELRAEELRQAIHAIGRITGRVDVEDVLGAIFSRFCIGK